MDEQVFDRLTRVLSGSSRRKMLATVGMALVGALVSPLLGEDALANGKRKPRHDQHKMIMGAARKRSRASVMIPGLGSPAAICRTPAAPITRLAMCA